MQKVEYSQFLNGEVSPMVMTTPRSQISPQSDWSRAFTEPIQAFPPTLLQIIEGHLPSDLRGRLYRNGPALFERNGDRIAHWFDGDGAILGIRFDGKAATGNYRIVNTAGYQAEQAAGKFKFGGYGRKAAGPFWQRPVSKNAANTSVLVVSDRLLALWEGGQPHALDLDTLETLGLDNLQGLEKRQTFSAHPKVDAQTGESYNFGLTFGRNPQLNLYRCDRNGQLRQQGKIPLDHIPLIHDFVLAGPYLVFCIAPVMLNPFPVLLRWKSYSDALRWHPEKGTQVLVIDRETLTLVAQSETDPWFQWHFGNGFVDRDGQIAMNLVRYPDFQNNRFLKEVPAGHPQTAAPGTLWQLRINPQTAKVTAAKSLSDRTCEFPVINPHEVGRASRFTYMTTRSDRVAETDLFDAIAVYDDEHHMLTVADLGENRYTSEPIFAPNPAHLEQGWILTVVYDSKQHCSEVWIYENQFLTKEPICRLALPEIIPFSFHGTWKAEK